MGNGNTIYTLNNVHVQVILPQYFNIVQVNQRKKNITLENYANAGFFAALADGSTEPVGNLIINGKIITNVATQPSWLNTARHSVSTLLVYNDYKLEIKEVSDISKEKNVKFAISGIPILKNGMTVKIDAIKKEGWYGNECYDTWHGFIGIQNTDKLVYVGAKTKLNMMPYLIDTLGLRNCIKLDGGGSFICHSDTFTSATAENRVIHNVISW